MQKHNYIVKIISVLLVIFALFAVVSDFYSKKKTKDLSLNNIKSEKIFQYPNWGENFSKDMTLDIFTNADTKRIFSSYPGEINCYKNKKEAFCYLDNKFVAKINFLNSLNQYDELTKAINDITKSSELQSKLFREDKSQDVIFHQIIDNNGITFSMPKNNKIIIIKNETLIDKILFNQELNFLKNAQSMLDELNKK